MLTSRGLNLTRALREVSKMNRRPGLQQVRNSGDCVYRIPAAKPARRSVIMSELLGGLAWWWILWHVWHEPEHLFGEFPYPDASQWTDEELGIPSDDVNI